MKKKIDCYYNSYPRAPRTRCRMRRERYRWSQGKRNRPPRRGRVWIRYFQISVLQRPGRWKNIIRNPVASDNTEYEYEINAKDGEILNYSTENLNNNGNSNAAANGTDAGQTQNNTQSNAQNNTQSNAQNNTQNSGQNNSGTTQNVNVQISEADAKAAALERVPGATEQDLRMELDRDDGKYIYEGDIIYQQKEYEFEIDANTGNFLKWSEERA